MYAEAVLDDIIDNELYLGFKELFNTTRKDCVWRSPFKDHSFCSDEVKLWLYSNGGEEVVGVAFHYENVLHKNVSFC